MQSEATLIAVADPRMPFIRVVASLFKASRPAGIHPTAIVSADTVIDATASIGPHVVIEGRCEVGARSVLHPHVVLYSGSRIGADVTIHACSVDGADGFGYQRNDMYELEKFPHLGGVTIGDGVEIGSNACIDRGALSDTVIGAGTKIDNLAHIAHNVRIGRHVCIFANAIVAGGVAIGDGVHIAPGSLIMNQIKIGESRSDRIGIGCRQGRSGGRDRDVHCPRQLPSNPKPNDGR